jgi:hypothetical protein
VAEGAVSKDDVEVIVAEFARVGATGTSELDMHRFADEASFRAETAIDESAVILFETPEGGFLGGMGGPFRGPEGMQKGWREWLRPWSSCRAAIEETVDIGDGRVLVLVRMRARLSDSGVEVDQEGAALYTVSDGRIVRVEHFLDQDQARRAAGLL